MNDYNRNGDYCDYGFDPIGNQLVSEFYKINPDFNIIENLLKQISDINIANKESEESILSESILGYPWSYIDDDDEDCRGLLRGFADLGRFALRLRPADDSCGRPCFCGR